VPAIADSGEWVWHGEMVLSDISESLESDVNPQFFDVDSIPDVWARPILFNMAFCDGNHPLHEKVIGEWRGMLALIGLSEWHGYSLEAQHVDLSALTDGKEGDSESIGFAEVASRMVPNATIDQQTDWSELYLFRLDENPIAITSPLTLVATATEYKAHGVGWWDGQVFRDPLGRYGTGPSLEDKLNAKEKGALSQWLVTLRDRLVEDREEAADDANASDSWNTLLAQIDDFVGDLQLDAVEDQLESRPDAFWMSGGSLFAHLDEVPIPPEPDLENSHVLLDANLSTTSEDLPDHLLIIADEIAEQWEMEPQNVNVYGVHSLSNVRNAGGNRNRLNERRIEGGEWRYASDLFSDHLGIIKESTAFNRSSTARMKGEKRLDRTPVIPLVDELLYYFSAEALANRTRIDKERGGSYRVQVELPLSGTEDEPRNVTFERVYSREEVIVEDESPLFETWPNFEAPDWSTYYTFYSGGGSFYLEAFPEPDPDDMRAEHLRHGEVGRAVARSEQFPEAALCFDTSGETYLGFVAVTPPKEATAAAADSWAVGVDFGTSNTTVYVLEEGSKPRPIRFKDRLVPITSEKSARLTETRDFFLPVGNQDVPFLTFFHDLPFAKDAHPGKDIRVPLEGHILYVETTETRNRVPPGDVHHDLKWSDTPSDRARTKAFLEQIVLQARAEAAANLVKDINWRYSFPSSFSSSQLKTFRSTWENLVETDAEKRTESLSTATYFLEAQTASMADGSVCVDIGGASADVAIWQNHKTLLQTSVLLASQEIFLKTVADEPTHYRELFDDPDFDKLCNSQASRRELITDLEELLVLKGDEFLSTLSTFSATDAASDLRQRIAFGVSGIFHYAGLLIKHLIESEHFDPEKAGIPNVYFGGNGAKMLHWLDVGGEFGAGSEISKLFETVLVEASGVDEGFFEVQMTPSEHVKHEVAYGLVIDKNLDVQDEEGSVLAGEAIEKHGGGEGKQSWRTELNSEILSNGIELGSNLDQLQNLLRTVNDFAEDNSGLMDPLPVGNEQLSKTRSRVRNQLREVYGREKDEIDVESVFVLGVKAYLDALRDQ